MIANTIYLISISEAETLQPNNGQFFWTKPLRICHIYVKNVMFSDNKSNNVI